MKKVSKKETDDAPVKRPKTEVEMIVNQLKMIGNVIRINDTLNQISRMSPEVTFTSVVIAMSDFLWNFSHNTETDIDKLQKMFFDDVSMFLRDRNNAEKGAS